MITPIVGNKYYQVYTNPVRLEIFTKTEEQEKGKF